MKLKYKFLINELGDSYVGVPMSDSGENFGGVLKFNKETGYIIELLNEGIDYDTLCSNVAKKFSISIDETKASIDEILAKLKEEALIEE